MMSPRSGQGGVPVLPECLLREVKLPALPGVRDGNRLWLMGSLQQLNPPLNALCNGRTRGSSPRHMAV